MLVTYTLKQAEKWDAIVRSFASYDIYYLSGYVKAFQIHGDGEPLLFYFEGEETRALNVVMKRDIAKENHFKNRLLENAIFDLATPYGYGGWLIEGEAVDTLFREYEEWCQNNKIVSEFVRFHPILENHLPVRERYEVIPLGETITMELSSPEIIWANLTSKNRNVIRKAQKNGVRIYNGRSPKLYRKFQSIYNETMDKDHAEGYYYFGEAFYSSILEDLAQNAQIFYASLNGEMIAASIMLAANGRMNYHLSGSVRESAHLAPTNLLLYEAALWGHANGYKTLYLGGGVGSGEDNLFKFKKAFCRGNERKRFHIGKKVIDEKVYKELTDMRGDLPKEGYFPRYRT